jgi:hypothetical protein
LNELQTPTPSINEVKLDNPSNYSKHQSWTDRTQYGKMLRGLIQSQLTQYKREKNRSRKTKIAQSVGFLIQVQSSLINSEKNLLQRIEQLEAILLQKRSMR